MIASNIPEPRPSEQRVFPFTAIVGQDALRLALLLNVVDPRIGGVIAMGHRGTGKTTTIRALADVMPRITRISGDPYGRAPSDVAGRSRAAVERVPVPVVDLPLGATEDRVCGTIDVEAALTRGEKAFEPGLLARANRGFLYIDEVNLLEDHLVDVLLDVAASGWNVVEREGVSIRHPARFVLIGSGNPEEGDLRPQLVDRFGLCERIVTTTDGAARVEVVRRRLAYERDPDLFVQAWESQQRVLRARIVRARRIVADVVFSDELLQRIAKLCARLELDGHRGELTMARAACAHAALDNRKAVGSDDLRAVAAASLRHRLRRDPLAASDNDDRLERELAAL